MIVIGQLKTECDVTLSVIGYLRAMTNVTMSAIGQWLIFISTQPTLSTSNEISKNTKLVYIHIHFLLLIFVYFVYCSWSWCCVVWIKKFFKSIFHLPQNVFTSKCRWSDWLVIENIKSRFFPVLILLCIDYFNFESNCDGSISFSVICPICIIKLNNECTIS